MRMTCERVLRYLKVGAFLHLITVVGLLTLVISARISFEFFQEELFVKSFFWGALALWALTIPFFSQFDAYGRYQNYKQIKDAIFEIGALTETHQAFYVFQMPERCRHNCG